MVLLALVPAFMVGIYQFGYRAVTLTLVCVIACVVLEYLMNKALKKRTQTIRRSERGSYRRAPGI